MVGLKRLREKGISPMEVNSFTGPQHTKHVIRTSIIKATPANPTPVAGDAELRWLKAAVYAFAGLAVVLVLIAAIHSRG